MFPDVPLVDAVFPSQIFCPEFCLIVTLFFVVATILILSPTEADEGRVKFIPPVLLHTYPVSTEAEVFDDIDVQVREGDGAPPE